MAITGSTRDMRAGIEGRNVSTPRPPPSRFMARVRIIWNPAASRTHTPALDAARRAFERSGWTAEAVESEYGDHARVLAREAVEEGVDVVAAYGGDGTIVHALDGVFDTEVPIGIIPGGTGNQLARNLRVPRSPAKAARLITHGRARPIDVGELRAGGEKWSFAVGCGAGFDAEIITTATREMKRRMKMGAYVVRGFAVAHRLVPTPARIEVDGAVTEMDVGTVLVVNCALLFPPYRPVRPGVRFDDGVLDVVAVEARGFFGTLGAMGKLVFQMSDPNRILHLRGSEIRVESDAPLPMQRDGEGCGTTPFETTVRPSAVRVFAG